MVSELGWIQFFYLFLFTHITILTVTIYLHRCVAHRALTLAKPVEHFFRFWSWMTTGQSTKEWAAVHRKHHAFCEKPEDPHSPRFYGIWKVLFDGVSLYRKEAKNKETIDKYGKFTPDDWIEKNIYSKYSWLGLVGLALLNLAMFGFHGIWIYILQIIWIPFWAAGVVNGVAHFKGYRNFNTTDDSTNISPIGFIIGGEELHNNHHAYPSSAKMSMKWYEFDIGWFWIRAFEIIGLAKVNRVSYLPEFDKTKQEITQETVETMLSHQSFIMKTFHKVTKRDVIKEIKLIKANRNDLNKFSVSYLKSIFYDLSGKLSEQEKSILDILLKNKLLNTFFSYRSKLLDMWTNRNANIHSLKTDLVAYYEQTKKSGNKSLENFAQRIVWLKPRIV